MLLVTDQVGTFKGRYVYGGGADQVLGEQTPADGFRWLVADHEGSIRRVMGLTGGTQRRLDYDAFGQRVASTATGESGALPRHGFTGQQWDAATSLGYFDARYYQADAARFLQADPAKDGTNGYAYAGNDPVNFTDASGLTAGFGRAVESGLSAGVKAIWNSFTSSNSTPPPLTSDTAFQSSAASTPLFSNPSGYLQDAVGWAPSLGSSPKVYFDQTSAMRAYFGERHMDPDQVVMQNWGINYHSDGAYTTDDVYHTGAWDNTSSPLRAAPQLAVDAVRTVHALATGSGLSNRDLPFDSPLRRYDENGFWATVPGTVLDVSSIIIAVRSSVQKIQAVNMTRRASGFGDLRQSEVSQIQKVVDSAGRPLHVVGSAAKGTRRGVGSGLPVGKGEGTSSDIDYLVGPSSAGHFQALAAELPSIDSKTGLFAGNPNPYLGPAIRFEPNALPKMIPMKTTGE